MGYQFEESKLHYWSREEKNANAEIDYLLTHRHKVLPVEVKAGKTGTLKSLHLFLYDKRLKLGLRFNMDKHSSIFLATQIPAPILTAVLCCSTIICTINDLNIFIYWDHTTSRS